MIEGGTASSFIHELMPNICDNLHSFVIFHKYLALYQKYLAIPQISGEPVELPDLKVSWIVIVVSWTVFFRRDPTPRS